MNADAIKKVEERINRLKEIYNEPSDMEKYGIERRELSHSQALSYIFEKSFHLGTFQKFVNIIYTKDSHGYAKSALNGLNLDNIQISDIKIKTEESTENGRCDIVIIAKIVNAEIDKLRIVIENKVCASENKDQTSRYYDHYSKDNQLPTLYVFLVPVSSDESCSCPYFVRITYQDIYDRILSDLSRNSNGELQKFVENYIKALGLPTQNSKTRNIMALDDKFKTGIENFFNDCGPDILRMLETENKVFLEKCGSDMLEMLDILNADTDSAADAIRQKYGDEILRMLPKERAKEVLESQIFPLIEEIAIRNDIKSYEEICDLFPKSLVSTESGSAHLIYNKNMLKNINDKYGKRFPIKVYDQEYYVLAYPLAWTDHGKKDVVEHMETHPEYFNAEEIEKMNKAIDELERIKILRRAIRNKHTSGLVIVDFKPRYASFGYRGELHLEYDPKSDTLQYTGWNLKDEEIAEFKSFLSKEQNILDFFDDKIAYSIEGNRVIDCGPYELRMQYKGKDKKISVGAMKTIPYKHPFSV